MKMPCAYFKKVFTFAPAFDKFFHAEIAQLVEHNLAKVGVAGSSPVFRSANPEAIPLESGFFCNFA